MKIMLLAAATLSLGVGAADADNKDNAREKLPIWGSVPRTVSARELSLAADIRLPRPGAEAGPCIRVW